MRLGGEEFLVVLAGADDATTDTVAERLRRVVADAPVPLTDGRAFAVTISLGVTQAAAPETIGPQLAHADAALYAAKQAGRNCTRRAQAFAT